MKHSFVLFLLLSFGLSCGACAQSLEDFRGGWIGEENGKLYIYYIVTRNNKVSGFTCSECDNPNNLNFIDDGALNSKGLEFYIYPHQPKNAPIKVLASIGKDKQGQHLLLQKSQETSGQSTELKLHRAPPNPLTKMSASPSDSVTTPQSAVLPGPEETITPEKVRGMWLWGTGSGRQHFIFRPHKKGVRGMVCGPCNDPGYMAPLEEISLNGTTLHFEIVHEDNGIGFDEHGPHSNITNATISHNEMHLTVVQSFAPALAPIPMTLLGPVIYQQPSN